LSVLDRWSDYDSALELQRIDKLLGTNICDRWSLLDPELARKRINAVLGADTVDGHAMLDHARRRDRINAALERFREELAQRTLEIKLARANELLRQRSMAVNGTPTFGALGDELAKLRSEMEDDARKFIADVQATREKKNATLDKGKKSLSGLEAARQQLDKFIDDFEKSMEGTNSPPT
jgi:hypothetical protein